ncbi:hypothetical protein HanPSC8_Chr08g0314551 [Helianthus annuus]|nr:hypothetical protein HanPSC8_Chr08g0314551 [Helianthus annuus]
MLFCFVVVVEADSRVFFLELIMLSLGYFTVSVYPPTRKSSNKCRHGFGCRDLDEWCYLEPKHYIPEANNERRKRFEDQQHDHL